MGKERMLITGGHALEGEVKVSGGKNTAVAVIPATLLCDEPCTIENLPDIEDVHALADILTELGAKVDYEPCRRYGNLLPERPASSGQLLPAGCLAGPQRKSESSHSRRMRNWIAAG